jgi:hypothetical protein
MELESVKPVVDRVFQASFMIWSYSQPQTLGQTWDTSWKLEHNSVLTYLIIFPRQVIKNRALPWENQDRWWPAFGRSRKVGCYGIASSRVATAATAEPTRLSTDRCGPLRTQNETQSPTPKGASHDLQSNYTMVASSSDVGTPVIFNLLMCPEFV